MATATESIAATSVMWSIGSEVVLMDKQEFRNEKLYQTTMLMARKMLFEYIICRHIVDFRGEKSDV